MSGTGSPVPDFREDLRKPNLIGISLVTELPYTVGPGEFVIVSKPSAAGAGTINLPAGGKGALLLVKDGKGDAGTNALTIAPYNDTIDGDNLDTIAENYGFRWYWHDGVEWHRVATSSLFAAGSVSAAAVLAALAAAAAAVAVNGQKITGLAAGTAAGDAIRWEQGGLLIAGGSGASGDTVGAATKYLPRAGNVASAQAPLAIVTRAGVLRSLRVSLNVAPGGSDTAIFTVQKSSDNGATWTDTTLTCTVTGSAKSASDTTHFPAVAAGDLLAVKAVSSAGTAAGPVASFELL